jgi:hypothetical protein
MAAVTVGKGCRVPPPGWIAPNADYFVVSSRFIAGSGGRRTTNYGRTGRSGHPASGRQLF